jgi:hypothetical protein
MGFTAGIRRRRDEWADLRAARRQSKLSSELDSLRESLESDWSEVASLYSQAEAAATESLNHVSSSILSNPEAGVKALSSMDSNFGGPEGYSSIGRDLDVMRSLIQGITNASIQDVDSKELLGIARGVTRDLSDIRCTIQNKSRHESRCFESFESNMQYLLGGSDSGVSARLSGKSISRNPDFGKFRRHSLQDGSSYEKPFQSKNPPPKTVELTKVYFYAIIAGQAGAREGESLDPSLEGHSRPLRWATSGTSICLCDGSAYWFPGDSSSTELGGTEGEPANT